MLKYKEIKNLVEDESNLPLLNKIAVSFGISDFKEYVSRMEAFTLAEMLVVMLIGSIFMAASMPIITKRTKTLSEPVIDEIWRYTTNKSDIYYEDKVNIGTDQIHTAQLFVSSAGTAANPQIGLGVTGGLDAYLRYGASNRFTLGSGSATADSDGSIAIGHNAKTYTSNGIAIGTSAVVNADDLASEKAAGHYITFNILSFSYYSAITNLHNFISGYTQHTYFYVLYYGYYTAAYADPVFCYTYGVGYVVCYYNYHPAVYVPVAYAHSFYYTPVYSYRYSQYRALGAYDHFYVTVQCPDRIEVKSHSTGISEIVYADTSETGATYIMFVHAANGNAHWTYNSSVGLYHYDLTTNLPSGGSVVGTACSIYHNYATHLKLVAAHDRVRSAADALFATSHPSIAIGNNAKATNSNAVAIGYGSHANKSNQIVLGNSSSTLYVNGSAVSSDLGLKNIKGFYRRGINELRKLKTYMFSFKNDKENITRVGLIAQDVQKVMPEAVTVSDKEGHLAIKNEFITYAMFNAILDLDDAINAVSKRQFVLERKVSKQEMKIKKLEKAVNELKKNN
ncbi:MAG: tail fiber domain-containing protein [bacterium]|nr:tail fiber domain-containing protein [bacterium]